MRARAFVKLLVGTHEYIVLFARGVRGHAPPRKFLKMVQFGAFREYFAKILSKK